MSSMGNNQDDDRLLVLLAADLDQHFEELVLRYKSRLEAHAFDLINNRQDAEDVVQDAFLRVYYALKSYTAQRIYTLKLRAWLYTIVRNTCHNSIRRQKSPASILLSASEKDDQFPEIEVDDSELPERVVEATERVHEIERTVQALPECYREIVRLHLLEGFCCKEIASMLKRPIGTVKVYIRRGIAILADNLGE